IPLPEIKKEKLRNKLPSTTREQTYYKWNVFAPVEPDVTQIEFTVRGGNNSRYIRGPDYQ
ncbi:8152_t:CDS:1, partial [Paraglomus occultum]